MFPFETDCRLVRRCWCCPAVASPLVSGRCDAAHHVPKSTPQTQMQCITASLASLCLILPKIGTGLVKVLSRKITGLLPEGL